MYFKVIVCVLVLLYLSQTIISEGKEFCQSFADNNYTIDYGYYLDERQSKLSAHYLFIGDQYWILDWPEGKVPSLRKEFSYTKPFDKNLKERCAFILDEYELRICNSSEGNKVTGLLIFEGNVWIIKWLFVAMDSKDKKLNYRSDESTHQFRDLPVDFSGEDFGLTVSKDYNTSVCFNLLSDSFCFLEQSIYDNRYKCYRIWTNNKLIVQDDRPIADIPNKEFKDKVLAIFPQFKILDKHYINGKESNSYLFLHKKERSIYYCFSPPLAFFKECINESKPLIDCSGAPTPTESSDNLSIPLIVIGLLVILVIGYVVLYLIYRIFLYYSNLRQKNKTGKPFPTEVETIDSETETKKVTKPSKKSKKSSVK